MGRNKKPVAPLDPSNMDEDAVRQASDDANELGRQLVKVDEQYGSLIPYERGRIIEQTRFHLSRSAESMLEAGRNLILLKEHEPHGDFMDAVEQIGIDYTVASRMMKAAVKFSSRPNIASTQHLNKTKLIELTVLDDEDLDELEKGGTVIGVKLDDVGRMSMSELRKFARDARAEKEADERVIAEKDKKINALTRPRTAIQEYDKTIVDLKGEINTIFSVAEEACGKFDILRRALDAIDVPEEADKTAKYLLVTGFTDRFDRLCSVMAGLQREQYLEFDAYINTVRALFPQPQQDEGED